MIDYPLFDAFPDLLRAVPRVSLGRWPTPVMRLARFGAREGMRNLWIKREDLSARDCGGNKIRGLEFLLADALARGASTVLTLGAAGSFHVRATAVCAPRVGLSSVALLVHQPRATYVRANLAVARRAGAQLVPVRLPFLPFTFLREFLRRRPTGGRAYFIPAGGTSPLSCVGHVNAALELRAQIRAGALPEPDYLFVPLGSLGTAAGLTAGARLAGLKTRIIGVVVFHPWYCTAARWARLARRTLRFMAARGASVPDVAVAGRDLTVIRHAWGSGYAQFTREGVDLARAVFETEGIALDGTYSAKMYAGALRFLRDRRIADANVLLWHTFDAAPTIGEDVACEVAGFPRGLRPYFTRPPQPLDEALPHTTS